MGWQFADFDSYGAVTYGKTLVLLTLEGNRDDAEGSAVFHPTASLTPAGRFSETIEGFRVGSALVFQSGGLRRRCSTEVMKINSTPVVGKPNFKKRRVRRSTCQCLDSPKEDFCSRLMCRSSSIMSPRALGRARPLGEVQYQKKAKMESVEVDPDDKVQFDRNNFNNSRTAEANGAPASKLANYWMVITQFFAQILTWWLV
jgi:hypothetical protein